MKLKNIILLLIIVSNSTFAQKERYKKTEKNTLEGTKFGILDIKENKQVIPNIYSQIGDYTKGKFVAVLNNKAGLIDSLNTTIIPFQYTTISDFFDDRIFLTQNQKCAMANEKGTILTKFEFDEILGYEDGIVRMSKNNKIGYLDKSGKTIIQPKFDEAYDCAGNFILVYTSSWKSLGYQYVQKDYYGNVLDKGDIGMSGKLPIIFNKKGVIIYKGQFSEKIMGITPNKKLIVSDRYLKMGTRESKIIDSNGKIIHQFDGQNSVTIEKEWIKVSTETGVGIIDFDGKIRLKPNFKEITGYNFRNNELAKVKFKNDEFFYIDKDVKCIEFENKTCPE